MLEPHAVWRRMLHAGELFTEAAAWFRAFDEGRTADDYAGLCGLLVSSAAAQLDANPRAIDDVAASPALRRLMQIDRRCKRMTNAAWRLTWPTPWPKR